MDLERGVSFVGSFSFCAAATVEILRTLAGASSALAAGGVGAP